MADKQAKVRLSIDGAGFTSALNKLKGDAARSGQDVGKGFGSGISNGVKGGFDAILSGFDRVKSAALTFGGILGGVGVVELGMRAVETEAKFRALNTAIELGTGRVGEWSNMQRTAQQAAERWAQSSSELADTMRLVFKESGDADFVADSIDTIAMTARATKEPIDDLGRVAGILNQKFGITASELPDAMTTVVSAANRSGVSIQDLADDFGELGGKAKTLGMDGQAGLEQMLGILQVARQETGNFQQAMTALPQIFDALIEQDGKDGKLIKMGIQTVDASGKARNPSDIIADLVEKTGGDASALGEFGFGGEGLQTVLAIADKYKAELESNGGDTERAKEKLADGLREAGQAAVSSAQVQQKAASEMGEADAKMKAAMEKLEKAFASEGVAKALDQLAEVLPPVADAFAKMLEFATDNPALTGAALVGSKIPLGGGGGIPMGALGAGGAGAGAGAAAGGGGALAAAGPALAGIAALVAVAAAADQGIKLYDEVQAQDNDLDGRQLATNLATNAIKGGGLAIKDRHNLFNSGSGSHTYAVPKAGSVGKGADLGVDDIEELDGGYYGSFGNVRDKTVATIRMAMARQAEQARQASAQRHDELQGGLPSFVTGGSGSGAASNPDAISAPITASVDRVADSLNRTLTVHIPGTVTVRNAEPAAPSSGIDARNRR